MSVSNFRWTEEVKRVISIPSISNQGTEEICAYFASIMKERGIKVLLQQVTHSISDYSKRQFNLVGILGDPLVDRKTKKGLLLLSHLDTCPPGRLENWKEADQKPFMAKFESGRVIGLGSADGKLDFLCKLIAVSRSREKKLKQPVYLAGVCGGQMGLFGTKYLLQSKTLNPACAMAGAPTFLKMGLGHKSSAQLRVGISFQQVERDARGFNRRIAIKAKGVTGHSAYPQGGKSALNLLHQFIQLALEQGFELQFTKFYGGESALQISNEAYTEVFLTSHQFEDFKRFFRQVLKNDRWEEQIEVDFGGSGDAGISFLPEKFFSCFSEIFYFVQTMQSKLKSSWDDRFDVPYSTIELTQVEQSNGKVGLCFDLRVVPKIALTEILEQLQEGLKEVCKGYPHFNLNISPENKVPHFEISAQDEWVQKISSVLEVCEIRPSFEYSSFSSEAGLLLEKGISAITFGSGISSGNIHAPNESNELRQLDLSIKFYEELIERVCS